MNQAIEGFPVNEIDKLYEAFKSTINTELSKDDSEWDMEKIYVPTWACIWNKPERIGQECKIHSKNSVIAAVMFKDTDTIHLENVYRLEDLQIKS